MTDKKYEDVLEDYMEDHVDDEDDERFYSETVYNEYYYIEKEQEEIRDFIAEIEDEEKREQEELEEYLLSLSPREYIEWKRERRKPDGKYAFGVQEAVINVNKVRYPYAIDGNQIRAIEERIMSMKEEPENEIWPFSMDVSGVFENSDVHLHGRKSRSTTPPVQLKKILNQHEDATHQKLQEACKQYGASVFAKVRLADVLPIENSGISDIEYRFALQSHFDFIVCDSTHAPLFVVEFDGPTHESETQKERDQKKASLCERFELPLLRINSKYLSRQYRDYDLLTWFVEVWFLEREFDEAQAGGSIPLNEPFDPMMFINLPGRKNKLPRWLSIHLRAKIQRLHKTGKCAEWFPSQWIGTDGRGNIHGLSWIGVNDNWGVVARTGIRSQKFPILFFDVLRELLVFQIYEELTLVLEGKSSPVLKSKFEIILAEFKTKYKIISSQVPSDRISE